MKQKKAKSQKRKYFGASLAAPLVKWLNSATKGEGRDMVKLISIEEELRSPLDRNERVRATARANTIVSSHGFYPLIVDMKGRWRTLWQAQEPNSIGDYVHRWLELLEMGLAPQLKRCGYCRKFFFAKFPHNKYDTLACRDKAFRHDPERREKRRAWERDYYRKHLKHWRTK